jgi:ADP-ribose pyrophosphatase YjhB (NUDIX family)
MDSRWLDWSQKLQALAQNGLTYARDPFDIDRYEKVAEIAAEMLAAGSGLPPQAARAIFSAERGYATPKIDVRGVVIRDGAVLLVRENSDGRWSLPGGWADVGNAPSTAVTREILEEAGYRTRAARLLALLDRNRHGHDPFPFHIYKVFFLCEILEELPLRSIESHERGFFRPDALPPLSTTRVTEELIRRVTALALDPAAETLFD